MSTNGEPLTRELAEKILSIEFTDLQWSLIEVIVTEERQRAVAHHVLTRPAMRIRHDGIVLEAGRYLGKGIYAAKQV